MPNMQLPIAILISPLVMISELIAYSRITRQKGLSCRSSRITEGLTHCFPPQKQYHQVRANLRD